MSNDPTASNGPFSRRFAETITSVDRLREIIPEPSELVADKETPVLDEHCRRFIARSPFVIIASGDGRDRADLSPKGDPPGFVAVLDDTTLAIPERPGNRRADTFLNVLINPVIGLLFLVPGTRTSLRVRGVASIVRDPDLNATMAIEGREPELALVVDVTAAMFHCAKCIIRSGLWAGADSQAGPGEAGADDSLALAESMVDHGQLSIPVEKLHQIIVADERDRLY